MKRSGQKSNYTRTFKVLKEPYFGLLADFDRSVRHFSRFNFLALFGFVHLSSLAMSVPTEVRLMSLRVSVITSSEEPLVDHSFPFLSLQLLNEFKAMVVAEDKASEQKLAQLKTILLEMDSLPPLCVETPSAAEERKFAMEVFEYAVILSIHQEDRDSFNRYMSCLKPYYLNYTR